MEKYYILDDTNLEAVKEYLASNKYTIENDLILTDEFEIELAPEYREFLETLKKQSQYSSDLIYGKDKTIGIVGLEIVDDELWLFKADGTVEKRPNTYWIMSPRPQGRGFERLLGNQHYKYIKHYDSKDGYYSHMKDVYNKKADCYTISNSREASMVIQGITMYKGLQLSDLGILAFDIEGEGLTHHSSSNVFLITNVFKKNGIVTKKHFRLDHYEDAGKMIDDWCKWVQEVNPDIITGHNINGYDLPYLHHVAKLYGTRLYLGRDLSEPRFSNRDSEYRVDGSQSWSYKRISLFGREIIDGMFLAVKYDIGRKYSSWGLKAIAEAEGLVKEGRQFYDASKIAENWKDLNEREKIVQYGLDDAMDSLQLFELMIPAYFMLCKLVPKPFQSLTEGASGSWLNAMMVRAYLQEGYSIPKGSETTSFEGAISFGNPGVYKNCFKIDIVSEYPSIIRQYKVHCPTKDPMQYLLKMTTYFFETRVYHKKLGKQTGDQYHIAMDSALKIAANSIFGFLGAPGLNFNYPEGAAMITAKGREILNIATEWATNKPFEYWNRLVEGEEENEDA